MTKPADRSVTKPCAAAAASSSRHLYFSCPKFTVLLVLHGDVIIKAAPIVKRFEGQTLDALASWAKSRFGGPIIVEKLP